MDRNISITNRSTNTSMITNSNKIGQSVAIESKSSWITDEQIMQSLAALSNGIIAVYYYYFEDEKSKDFRIFYDYQDMISTIANEIYTVFSNGSLNIQDSINNVVVDNDFIIIPKPNETRTISIKIMNPFMTNEVFKSLKQKLNAKRIDTDKKFVRIKK